MKIKVLLFGSLSEIIGQNQLIVEGIYNTDALSEKVENDFPKIKSYRYLIAVNQEVIKNMVSLKDGDEVALLPPFAGG